jgi:pimeloyl-ACP methyl ester carboxylesterase
MPNELSALCEVAGEAVDRLVLTPAESLHGAIANRVFKSVGPASAPTRIIHDGITRLVYRGLRTATRSTSKAAGAALRPLADPRPLSASRRGRHALGALNAIVGDELEGKQSELAIAMSIRLAATDVPTSDLETAFPAATGRVAVLLHGLAETEEWWLRGTPPAFGERLQEDLGITPVYVRYNTGLHVSQNGARLARLLVEIDAGWPPPVRELILIGHSMGGLVARAAVHLAPPRHLRHLVTLGTPHTGAPLEKAVHAAAWALRKVPEARPLAQILDYRSSGIRDLRFGYLQEAEWRAEDPSRLLDDRRRDTPLLPGCTHTFVTATVTRSHRHPLGWTLGDLLVRTESASGRHRNRRVPVADDAVVHIGGLTHFDLLDHPRVYEVLAARLAAPPP